MTRDQALAAVTLFGDTAATPALTDAEVGAVLDRHAIPDADGHGPLDADWAPTYDVNAAAAEVWRVKAGRVAGAFNFTADGLQVSKGDLLAHMAAMEAKYAALAGSASGYGAAGSAGTLQVAGTNGPFDPLDKIDRLVIP